MSEVREKYYEDFYKKYGVVYLMSTLLKVYIESVRWYIDFGDDDYLIEGSSRVHIVMKNCNIPMNIGYEMEVTTGLISVKIYQRFCIFFTRASSILIIEYL